MIPLEVQSGPLEDSGDNSETSQDDDGRSSRDVPNRTSHGRPSHGRPSHGLLGVVDLEEEEEEEFEEVMGLLGSPSRKHPALFEEETPQGLQNSKRAWTWWILTMGLVAVISHFLGHRESQWEQHHTDERLPPVYQCPTPKASGKDDVMDPPTVDLDPPNTTFYSYDDLKANRMGWTDVQIAPYLLQSDIQGVANRVSILELASHSMGMNLFQTLDILENLQKPPTEHTTQFWVYGNDRAPFRSSFSFFHQDDALKKLPNVKLGILCAAEDMPPRDLTYLPLNTFDMVYTGRLPPLQDPLGFGGSPEELEYRYQSLCRPGGNRDKDEKGGIPLKDLAQQAQEEWSAAWVTDMARVTRPGGLIVIENLSVPFCESTNDFGGISPDWWRTIVQQREDQWQIDPSSLQIGIDSLRSWRYNVAMRRKGTT